MELSIIIPTLNAQHHLNQLLPIIKNSTKGLESELIIVDSESTDNTVAIARQFGAIIINMSKKYFNHGGTRNLAVKSSKGKLLLFLTQDATPLNTNTIYNLIAAFKNPNVVIAYGRQIPYKKTSIFGNFSRQFNYPATPRIKSNDDIHELGIKTAFCSNSFAMYRKEYFDRVGGFPEKVILGEDMYLAGKAILAGYKVAYVPDAQVYHSHSYTILDEFQRSFDTGVFHKKENWLIEKFNSPNNEGIHYVKSECKFLMKNNFAYLIPYAIIRNICKYIGYKFGYHYNLFPKKLVKRMSMYKSFWN